MDTRSTYCYDAIHACCAHCQSQGIRDDGSVVEIVIWELPEPVPPCTHRYKFRLYHGSAGVCHVRYDNERGKGDHRHLSRHEEDYVFSTLTQLLADFERDVQEQS